MVEYDEYTSKSYNLYFFSFGEKVQIIAVHGIYGEDLLCFGQKFVRSIQINGWLWKH